MSRFIWVVLLLFCLSTHAGERGVPDVSPVADRAAVTSAGASVAPRSDETVVLKQQLTTMREYHSSLLDTVYWALAGVFTLVVLLAGFGWWSNFKVYEQDKQRLKDELLSVIRTSDATLALRLEEGRSAVDRLLEAKLESVLSVLRQDVVDVKKAIADERDSRTKINVETQIAIKKIDELLVDQSRSISMAEANLRSVEENVWELMNIPENILMTQVQGLHAVMNANRQGQVEAVLRRMQSTLQRYYLSGKSLLDQKTADLIDEELATVRGEHQILSAEVRRMIADAVRQKPLSDERR
jgi:hypothetical protein